MAGYGYMSLTTHANPIEPPLLLYNYTHYCAHDSATHHPSIPHHFRRSLITRYHLHLRRILIGTETAASETADTAEALARAEPFPLSPALSSTLWLLPKRALLLTIPSRAIEKIKPCLTGGTRSSSTRGMFAHALLCPFPRQACRIALMMRDRDQHYQPRRHSPAGGGGGVWGCEDGGWFEFSV